MTLSRLRRRCRCRRRRRRRSHPGEDPRLPSTSADDPLSWHATAIDVTLRSLNASSEGLSESEAAARLLRAGPNRLPRGKKQGPLRRLLLQFHNLLIYVLLAAAALSLFLDHTIDAAVILGVVVINAIIGFIQEGRAERALDAIGGMIDPKATDPRRPPSGGRSRSDRARRHRARCSGGSRAGRFAPDQGTQSEDRGGRAHR